MLGHAPDDKLWRKRVLLLWLGFDSRQARSARTLSRCLLSLSQKLNAPSLPAVTNVPYLRAQVMHAPIVSSI